MSGEARTNDGAPPGVPEAPTFVGLFSGCGGMDSGFTSLGYQCLMAVDNDPEALSVHSANLGVPTAVVDLALERPPDDVLRRADVFVCGPPCQGFSTIGGRRPLDPRNSLLVGTAKLASVYQPSVVVIENVLGARSRLHNHHWVESESLLRSSGYRTATLNLDMEDLGIPQTRRRAVMIAWRSVYDGDVAVESVASRVTLAELLAGADAHSDHDVVPIRRGTRGHSISRSLSQGQKLCNVRASPNSVRTWSIPAAFGPTTHKERLVLEGVALLRRRNRLRSWGDADPVLVRDLSRHLGWATGDVVASLIKRDYLRRIEGRIDLVHTFNGKYRRPRMDGAAPTVDTRFGDYHYFLHPVEHRGFTVREAARIQSFPDSFKFQGGSRAKFRMIGNAVPPLAAQSVARLVLKMV